MFTLGLVIVLSRLYFEDIFGPSYTVLLVWIDDIYPLIPKTIILQIPNNKCKLNPFTQSHELIAS